MQTTVHGEGNIYHFSKKCRLNEVSDNDNVNSAFDTENNMAKDVVTSFDDATQDIDGLEPLAFKDCKNQNHYPLTIQENGYCKINKNITNDSFPSLMSVQMNLEVIPKSAEKFPKFSESLLIQHTQNFSKECGKDEVTSLKIKTKSNSSIKIPGNEEFVCKTVDTNKSLCEKRINNNLENVSSCTTDVSNNIINQYSGMHEYSCSVSIDDTQSESLLKETGIQNSFKTKTPVVSTMPRPVYPFNPNINEIPIGFQRIEDPKSLTIVRLEPKHPDSATLPPQSNHPTLKQVPVNMKTVYNKINSPQVNNSIYYPVPQLITITKSVSNNETSVPYIAPSVLALKNSVQKTFTQVPVVMKNIWNGNQFSQSTNNAKPHSVFQPTTHTKSVSINSVATTSSPAPSMSVIKSVSSINIKEPRKFVDLQQLIRSGILKPDTNVLSLHTPERIVFASLDENGRIISNGKLYDTPMQWCNEFPNFFKQGGKKKRDFCYRRIYYQGRTLRSYANSWNQGPSGRATVSQAVEGSSILGDSGSDPEVTQRSIAPWGDSLIHLEPPDCGPGVLNLSKMKLLMIGDNEVGPISIDKWPDLHWEDINKW
ncbi:hypothetical protein JTE90_022004 [Oedothorax gibbosus]|uniref:RAMA domain-containing protein n=1 Tax=Oedothorax gibbosus TaxID=931172 RepID=A0AAV6V3G2_9ARAC|nr:hypothetical protein JTE90_022004 [Oedothorax gibbosus]